MNNLFLGNRSRTLIWCFLAAAFLSACSGFNNKFEDSENNLPVAAKPTASPGAGEVAPGTLVTLSTTTEGAEIYYTTDGSDISADSARYTDPIPITEAMTITAYAAKDGFAGSNVLNSAYTINENLLPVAAMPTASPGTGRVAPGTRITLSTSTEGAVIYYTKDESNPSASSTVYTAPIPITQPEVIKAIAIKDGFSNSEILISAYLMSSGSNPVSREYITGISLVASRTSGGNKAPEGFSAYNVVLVDNKTGTSHQGEKFDFNEDAGGDYIYMYYKKASFTSKSAAISGGAIAHISVIEGENASAPAGWTKINLDLNKKAGGKYLYLIYRTINANDSAAISLLNGVVTSTNLRTNQAQHDNEFWNNGYTPVRGIYPDGTNGGNAVDLNMDAGGKYVYLKFKTSPLSF